MSHDNRENYHSQPPPVYTVSGAYPHNVDYGFHPSPPPKYEDAVRGTPMEQAVFAHEGVQPAGVILVSPDNTSPRESSNKGCLILLLIFYFAIVVYVFTRVYS